MKKKLQQWHNVSISNKRRMLPGYRPAPSSSAAMTQGSRTLARIARRMNGVPSWMQLYFILSFLLELLACLQH